VVIESGGGEYMGAMEARSTTHLVAEVRRMRISAYLVLPATMCAPAATAIF